MKQFRNILTLALIFALLVGIKPTLAFPYGTHSLAAGGRLSGNTREYTAAAISKDGWPGGSDYAVLVNGYTFADALAAGPLAQKLDVPILLTQKDVLPSITKAEINRLGVKKVYIVGGTGVIPDAVAKATGKTFVRIAGDDRFETAVAVAEKLKELGVSTEKVVIARSDDYADALAAAAVKPAMPILFAGKAKDTSLADATEHALTALGVKDAVIVGGTGAVSAAIEEQIKGIVANVTRVAGDDRFKTAVAIAEQFKPADGYKGAVLATGYGFADALAGGPYAAKNDYALIMVNSKSTQSPLSDGVISFIKANAGIKADTIVALGGAKVVPDKAVSDAAEVAGAADELDVIDVY